MSHRLVLTVSNDHFNWLEIIQKKKGLENIQEAIRSVLEDGYSHFTESGAAGAVGMQTQTLDKKKRGNQAVEALTSITPPFREGLVP